ncbi:TetR family transcriptional regulator [Streptomyces sp. MS1.HAVA.3]|uniref:TetR family transcriptional regulator n=1 Tax=Streptomyces caledonius TaxID=3134107 RepID=A0ABU8UD18_9ACTN
MRQNPQRRAALLDAAIEVLAREGSRGLTLRAVDAEAGVPTGTASNYFANRAQLLVQILHRTRERLVPDPADLTGPLDTKVLLGQLVDRMRRERSVHIAMLELRLEGTRRPNSRRSSPASRAPSWRRTSPGTWSPDCPETGRAWSCCTSRCWG